MLPNEMHLLRRLEVLNDPRTYGATIDANRSRYISSLRHKQASGEPSEPERLKQAEAAHAAARQEERQRLLRPHQGGHPARPGPTDGGLFSLLASKVEQADEAARVQAEARQWRVAATRREAARQRWASAAPSGSQVGAHERGLASIARTNGHR